MEGRHLWVYPCCYRSAEPPAAVVVLAVVAAAVPVKALVAAEAAPVVVPVPVVAVETLQAGRVVVEAAVVVAADKAAVDKVVVVVDTLAAGSRGADRLRVASVAPGTAAGTSSVVPAWAALASAVADTSLVAGIAAGSRRAWVVVVVVPASSFLVLRVFSWV